MEVSDQLHTPAALPQGTQPPPPPRNQWMGGGGGAAGRNAAPVTL
jgi:hypothetical protein